MFDNTLFTGLDKPLPDLAGYEQFTPPTCFRSILATRPKQSSMRAALVTRSIVRWRPMSILSGVLDSAAPAPLSVDFVRLPYDIEAAIDQARQSQLPDLEPYSIELRTGIYRRFHKNST